MAKLEFGPGGSRSRWTSRSRRVICFPEADQQERGRFFAFSYADIAAWCGVTAATIRTSVSKGELDPTSFDSLLEYRLKARRPTLPPMDR